MHEKINSMLATVGVRSMGYRKTACFEVLVLEPYFDQILRLLPGTLLSPWLAEFAASIIFLEDATCEMIALSNTCRLHMIRSQDEESSGSFSSFHATPIQGRPYIVAKKDTNFRRQKRTQNKPLIPACLDHDNLSLAVVMLMKDVPCIES